MSSLRLLDHRHRPTGKTRHEVSGSLIPTPAALAICRYESNPGYYLFYCDSDWRVSTDTWHPSLDAARQQAEFEFEGIGVTWKVA